MSGVELTGDLRIDLSNFEKLSREVGYYNHKSNIKDSDDLYDIDAINKYGELREAQLIMFEKFIQYYTPL